MLLKNLSLKKIDLQSFFQLLIEIINFFLPLSILFLLAKKRCHQFVWSYFITSLYWATSLCSLSLFLTLSVLSFYLLMLSFFDADYFLLPDHLTLLLLIFGVAINMSSYHFIPFYDAFYGFIIGSGLFYSIYLWGYLIYQRCVLGFGDVKLFGAIGMCCGIEKLPYILLLGSFLGVVLYVVIWLTTQEQIKKIPFGSCLAFSTLMVLGM